MTSFPRAAFQASTLTSVFPPKRTKISFNDGQFEKVSAKMTDKMKQFLIKMLKHNGHTMNTQLEDNLGILSANLAEKEFSLSRGLP